MSDTLAVFMLLGVGDSAYFCETWVSLAPGFRILTDNSVRIQTVSLFDVLLEVCVSQAGQVLGLGSD